MAWSYRRRVKLIPGVYLNFSKGGISTSIGVRGASITLGKQGTYVNTGIPGTGLHNRRKISANSNQKFEEGVEVSSENFIESESVIVSVDAEKVTSQDMLGIKESIINSNQQRGELTREIKKIKLVVLFSKLKLYSSYILVIGLVSSKLRKLIESDIELQKRAISELKIQKENLYVNLDIEFDEDIKREYDKVVNSFQALITSQKIWDVTKEFYQNRVAARSSASTLVEKKVVKCDLRPMEEIKSQLQSLYFPNANRTDLYIYPNFIVLKSPNGNFGLVDFKELDFQFASTRFVETGLVPRDSKVIDWTWTKVNKNGTPDKRFKDNRKIPVVEYGTIYLRTQTGMNEEYEFSNHEASKKFAQDFYHYQEIIKSLANKS